MEIQKLIDSLHTLNHLHREMLDVSEKKKSALILGDVKSLIEIMNHESRLLKQIEQAEERRIDACRQFLQLKGIKSQLELTLTELTRLVFDPDEKKTLQDAQARLSSTLDELKNNNELNQKLLEQSMEFVNYSIELLGVQPDQEITYAPSNDKSSGYKGRGYFDARA